MKTFILAAILALSTISFAMAQTDGKSAQAVCGERWKAHKAETVDPGKGNRSAAWNTFRKENCADLKKSGKSGGWKTGS